MWKLYDLPAGGRAAVGGRSASERAAGGAQCSKERLGMLPGATPKPGSIGNKKQSIKLGFAQPGLGYLFVQLNFFKIGLHGGGTLWPSSPICVAYIT